MNNNIDIDNIINEFLIYNENDSDWEVLNDNNNEKFSNINNKIDIIYKILNNLNNKIEITKKYHNNFFDRLENINKRIYYLENINTNKNNYIKKSLFINKNPIIGLKYIAELHLSKSI